MGVIYYTARYISLDIYLAVWHGTCAWRLQIVLQFDLFKEFSMRTLLSIAVLISAALPALAGGGIPPTTVPEPETLTLLAIAAVALLATRRRK